MAHRRSSPGYGPQVAVALLLAAGCSDGPAVVGAGGDGASDADSSDRDLDGTPDALDCAPDDPSRSPERPEICRDQLDNDCDGAVDEDCPGSECGPVDHDEVWPAGEVHYVGCSVFVQGANSPVLTIADGAEVRFAPGTGLFVGTSWPGGLIIEGAAAPVVLRAAADDAAPGAWLGVTLGRYTSPATRLQGVVIQDAGGDAARAGALWASAVQAVHLEDVTVRRSAGTGVHLELESSMSLVGVSIVDNGGDGLVVGPYSRLLAFSQNLFSGNGGAPLRLPVAQVAELDEESIFTGNGQDAILVRGGFVGESATWAAHAVPYVFLEEVYVESQSFMPAVLTLPPGAELRFARGAGMKVGYGGAGELVAVGEGAEITFRAAGPAAPGEWDGLFLGDLSGPTTVLSHVRIEHAGGGDHPAAVYAYYASPTLSDCLIQDSVGAGVLMRGSQLTLTGCELRGMVAGAGSDDAGDGLRIETTEGGLTAFADNTISENAGNPVVLPATMVHRLDSASRYAGNDLDAVRVTGAVVTASATWRGLEVPYWIHGTIHIQGAAVRPVVQIEDATLAFADGGALQVGVFGPGDLVLRRSVLTAAGAQAPGAWTGLTFGSSSTAVSRVEDSEISWGGLVARPDASGDIVLAPTTQASVTNTMLRGSAGWGIYCQGGCAGHDGLLTGNRFEGNAAGDAGP